MSAERGPRIDYWCPECEKYSYKYSEIYDCESCGSELERMDVILGPSRLNDIKCPYRFKRLHIDKKPMPKTPPLAFGSKVHSVIDDFFNFYMSDEEEMLKDFNKKWGFVKSGLDPEMGELQVSNPKSLPYILGWYTGLGRNISSAFYKTHIKKRAEQEERIREGLKTIGREDLDLPWEAFKSRDMKKERAERRKILKSLDVFPKSEVEIVYKFGEHFIRVRLDFIYEFNGDLGFIDFKTSKYMSTPDNDLILATKPHQIALYSPGIEQKFKRYPKEMGLYYLRGLVSDVWRKSPKNRNKKLPIFPVNLTEDNFIRVDEDLTKAEETIRSGEFDRNIGDHCRPCGYYQHCLSDARDKRNSVLFPDPIVWNMNKIEDNEMQIEKHWETDLDDF